MNQLIFFLILAAAAGGAAYYFITQSKSKSTPVTTRSYAVYAPAGQWQLAYGGNSLTSQNPVSFDFDSTKSTNYLLYGSSAARSQGQTITAEFRLDGAGALKATEGTAPAAVHLYLERKGDDLTGSGPMQQYRWWSRAGVELKSPGSYTISQTLEPGNWTDVYGQPGSSNPDAFKAALADLGNEGMTFGGQFYGHGVVGDPIKFTLVSYTIK